MKSVDKLLFVLAVFVLGLAAGHAVPNYEEPSPTASDVVQPEFSDDYEMMTSCSNRTCDLIITVWNPDEYDSLAVITPNETVEVNSSITTIEGLQYDSTVHVIGYHNEMYAVVEGERVVAVPDGMVGPSANSYRIGAEIYDVETGEYVQQGALVPYEQEDE